MFALLLLIFTGAEADDTWVYAVQLSAMIEEDPPQITLRWVVDPYGSERFMVYRKAKESTSWGKALATLPGIATSYTDANVEVGAAYEYQVVKDASLGYKGYGYIYAGIRAPLVEDRGKLILVAETNVTRSLTSEMALLRQDLVGDGWQVTQIGVSSNDSPQQVRATILAEYWAAPSEVNTVFLIGHVPSFFSGNLDYDTHGRRALPADGYYGTLENWPLSPSPSFFPAEVTLQVGRVDFFNMPGLAARQPWPSEIELLRNYLRKDHLWRHGQIGVNKRALMGNSRGDEDGESVAATGYRAFSPAVGSENVLEANVDYSAPASERWISHLAKGSYLWAYGCGGGSPDGCGGLGTNVVNGVPGLLRSRDVIENDAKAVFVLLFGSWFADWTLTDNFMRSFLATPTMGLAVASAGRPHWYMHHMALGETIGYSATLSMNNESVYLNDSNGYPRAVFQSLMGDPSLRMEPVPPPTGLTNRTDSAGVTLTWSHSAAPPEGYHVYRASAAEGPFARITSQLVTTTSFVDASPLSGTNVYMVRAVTLQQNLSGSYYNPSQGIYTVATAEMIPIQLAAKQSTAGIVLTWNAVVGNTYRVIVKEDQQQPEWQDISGTLTATETDLSWTDLQTAEQSQKMYRVLSP